MRSDTAFFSADVISRRFLCGLTSGWLSAEAAVAFLGEERRDAERAAAGAEAPRSCSDVGQRLDLGLEAVDFALSVGNCLCDDTHGAGE